MNELVIKLEKQKESLMVMQNLLCMDQKVKYDCMLKSSIINKRFVSPQITDKNKVYEAGVSFSGIKYVLITLGYNAYDVEDVIDMYDKNKVVYLKKENNKNSVYINYTKLIYVINDILNILDKDRIKCDDDIVMNMFLQLQSDKIDYITKRLEKEAKVIDDRTKVLNIIKKYNVHDNLFYGYQQRNIWQEVCYELNVNMSFSSILKEFNINYNWLGKSMYNKNSGSDWLVCKIG